ncbi:MAG TPA: CCA tRNA nucleotidyltransferase [Alphaproteobacteria bacterium]|nr:CCA tRNA nucleotidyltransferase [Alphaproteobacteria bacterium]
MTPPAARKDRLTPQPWMTAPETQSVLAALGSGGAELRFVGGCVRDAVLDRAIGDVDIATPEPPALVMSRLADAGIKAIPTGIDHGTVTAIAGGRAYEITTLRRDVETFGRHARIAFTDDWREDAARRDLTFNALSCTPDGVLYDYFGGLEDLAQGRVRFVGDPRQRIAEDRLRLLRFFRFLAWYGQGDPDREGLAAAIAAAPELAQLSGERIQAEMLKLLAAPDPSPVLKLMADGGVLAHALPASFRLEPLAALIGAERLAGLAGESIRRLGALLKPDPDGVLRVAERWRLSNSDRDRLFAIVAPGSKPAADMSAKTQRLQLYRLGVARWTDHVLIAWSEALAQGRAGDHGRWLDLLRLPERWPPPALPVKGRDLMELGLTPGPEIGETMAALEEWWIGRDFAPDRQACLDWVAAKVRSASPFRIDKDSATPG